MFVCIFCPQLELTPFQQRQVSGEGAAGRQLAGRGLAPCLALEAGQPQQLESTVGCSFDQWSTALQTSGWPSCCSGFRVRMLSDGQPRRPGRRGSSGEGAVLIELQ